MSIQIAFSPEYWQLLSAQVVGYNGVDKRIDILSSVIQRKGTIYDLSEFEHAYAPPYSSAKDPVNLSGIVAENILQDRLRIFYWDELPHISDDAVLLDVRSEKEFEAGSIPNAINIPIDNLRERMMELDPYKKIYTYCQGELRG